MKLEKNIPFAPLTTFKIGGSARFFVRVKTQGELEEALTFARDKALQIFILGGGSNILVDDAGFKGLVIKIELAGLEFEGETVIAAAGESWDNVVEEAVARNLWGIENLSGIPGTVGGAVVQNIGAYGAALSQILEWILVYDRNKNEVKKVTKNEGGFGYRESFLKHEPDRYIVLSTALTLSSTPKPNLTYKDLAERFKDTESPLFSIREVVLEIRKNKFPDLTKEGTAGSFFKNPILSREDAQKLSSLYPQMPVFSIPESDGIKIPLAWILDHALTMRGMKVGSARLFERQPLVVVAEKGSSSADVKELAETVQKKVKEVTSIDIEPEVYFVA